jgi:predicted RNase H-like HicB family nuclease
MIDTDRYLILVGGGPPTNYGAWSPDVLGCVATSDTVEGCIAEMRSALAAHFEVMQEYGEEIPEPSGPGVYVEYDEAAQHAQ